MEAKAVAKHLKMSAHKMRPVADLVRDKNLPEAYDILTHTNRRAAALLAKAIRSAQANLEDQDPTARPEETAIKELRVDEGPTMKRWMPRAMGRATPINKRTSHVTVIVGNNAMEEL
ncbi:MAG: 50S ribosomal protein L22 [bacterium]